MTRWHWVPFGGAVSHAVSDELYHPTIAELRERGRRALWSRAKVTTNIFCDMGGMCFAHAPTELIEVDGLLVKMWCDEVGEHAGRLERLAMRTFRGGLPYYKLHFDRRCIVLTPAQRDLMLADLKAKAVPALARHDLFMVPIRKRTAEAEAARRIK